tara:strand:- start:36 stop:170 length:135 start_codon:yes stop_codon:yes gene_type:complete
VTRIERVIQLVRDVERAIYGFSPKDNNLEAVAKPVKKLKEKKKK